jgi:hypothetical protein
VKGTEKGTVIHEQRTMNDALKAVKDIAFIFLVLIPIPSLSKQI